MTSGHITIEKRLREHIESLKDLRERVDEARSVCETLLTRIDLAIEDVHNVADAVQSLIAEDEDAPSRTYLRTFGDPGRLVVEIAKKHDVPIRHVIGPGYCADPAAIRARHEAIVELRKRPISKKEVAVIMRVSFETVRKAQHKPVWPASR